MKKIVIISGTLNNNYKLSKNIGDILIDLGVTVSVLSLENYMLPLYTDKVFKEKQDEYRATVLSLINKLKESKGLIFCAPEYNGSIPPILSNFIAWLSISGDDFRNLFNGQPIAIATFSGGIGLELLTSLRIQLVHLGSQVLGRQLLSSYSKPIDTKTIEDIIQRLLQMKKLKT